MRLKPFFTYYGGKWRSTPQMYPVPKCRTIIEPFAGSAGYSLNFSQHQVFLYDKSEMICALWRFLISATPKEILSLPDLEEGQTTDDLSVHQEARWLIGFWLNKATHSPCKQPSAWMRGKSRPKSYWGPEIRQRVSNQVQAIRHWQVNCGTYSQCSEQDATWFIDPPYQEAGRLYPHGSANINYADLAMWCKKRKSQVIVCENEGAKWLPFGHPIAIKGQRAKCRKEVMWSSVEDAQRPLTLSNFRLESI